MRLALASAAALALAACSGGAGNNAAAGNAANPANPAAPAPAANEAAPANNSAAAAEPVLRSETVSGTFTGWEMGDYLWAKIDVPGRETISAQPASAPESIALVLDANRGRPVTVEVATVMANIPENGGATEIQRITGARNAAGTAEAWWQGLSEADRAAARRRFEEGALSGR